jgi:sulfite exporter TauE/SafE
MPWQIFLSGLALGAISSFHCIGMCGPLALALPLQHLPPYKKLAGIFLYNLGRVVTYSLLGLFFGFAGRQIYLGGLQQWFSIIIGCIILLGVFQYFLFKKHFRLKFMDSANLKLQQFIGRHIHQKQLYGLFLIGSANGFLPCGMVYFAIAAALATGSMEGGVGFMAAFGLGTIPLMALLPYFGFMISITVRRTIQKAVPYLIASMAILLILRGMNLGIPYVSPHFDNTAARTISCH